MSLVTIKSKRQRSKALASASHARTDETLNFTKEQQMSIVAREIGKLRRIELLLAELEVAKYAFPVWIDHVEDETRRIRKAISTKSVVIRNAEKEVKNNFKKVTIL